MVIQRKGKATKWNKIQNALKNANNIKEAYNILEQFRLTNEEECQIAQNWQTGKMILASHGIA